MERSFYEEEATSLEQLSPADLEERLVQVHCDLVDFYNKHNASNVKEDVLNILIQFYVDAGGLALNKKLKSKYGEDLMSFRKAKVSSVRHISVEQRRTIQAAKRQTKRMSLEKELAIQVPPSPKFETAVLTKSYKAKRTRRKRNRENNDPELKNFLKEKEIEAEKAAKEIEDDIFGKTLRKDDPGFKLNLLDLPNAPEPSPRDLLEAFYAIYDESKVEDEAAMDKLVGFVKDFGLSQLSKRLKDKYGEDLEDIKLIAMRRRRLEELLNEFYNKYDTAKLKNRWNILKIVNYGMTNGCVVLNDKFYKRYKANVIPNIGLDI